MKELAPIKYKLKDFHPATLENKIKDLEIANDVTDDKAHDLECRIIRLEEVGCAVKEDIEDLQEWVENSKNCSLFVWFNQVLISGAVFVAMFWFFKLLGLI